MADPDMYGIDPDEPSEDGVISRANSLLSEFNIATKIQSIDDITPAFFVVLYESLFSDKLPGIIRQPTTREDEIHNCQIVIDVLSTDIVRDSLSHIHAADIVEGNFTHIDHLLDIFSILHEYVMNRIDSDVPTDNDDTRSLVLSEPDVGTVPTKAPSRSMAASGDYSTSFAKTSPTKQDKSKVGSALSVNRSNNNRGKASSHKPSTSSVISGKRSSGSNNAGLNTNENRKVILHEDFHAMTENKGKGSKSYSDIQRAPSPIKPDDSQSLLGQKTIDSECSIDVLEKKERAVPPRVPSPKIAWDDKQADDSGRREGDKVAAVSAAVASTSVTAATDRRKSNGTPTDDIYKTAVKDTLKNVSSLTSSLPAPKRAPEYDIHDRLRSTVGPISYQSNLTPESVPDRKEKKEVLMKGFSSSLDDLQHLVEKTAAMTRFAIESSPVRARTVRDLDITDPYMDRPRPRIPNEGARLAKELNAIGLNSAHLENQLPNRVGKKVAFASTNDYHSRSDDTLPERSPLSTVELYNRRSAYKDDLEYDSDLDDYYDETDFRRKINNKDLAYGDTYFEVSKPAQKKKSVSTKGKTTSLATHLARNRQPELGSAHMILKTEDRAMQRKKDILQRMYDEDLDEFSEEVKYMLEKDTKKSQETEEELKKKCKPKTKKNVPKKVKGTLIPPSCKKPKISRGVPGSKLKKQTYDQKPVPADPPLKLECEEDLLPVILDEFPHLHLSEHTWHELWRRGLNQIESITRAYNSNKRKKSQAQSQLEDAAERHELLGSIMKKQLEHTKRVRDIKEQKQMTVQLRNKAHEKRIQSARARKYYNEFQVRARGKQLKRRTKEELIFRDLFKDALDIQKERIRDIRGYATDQRKRQESRRQNEIDSMENYYRDQFEMLTERLSKERKETELRDSAQQKMLEQMKRELRKKMECEIKQYQEQLFQDDDHAHWRQKDADRIKQQLHLARYAANI